MKVARTEGSAHDRLTRIAGQMVDAWSSAAETRDDDRCIVFTYGDEGGGIALSGYEDDTEAMAELLVSLTAIFKANGKTLDFIGIPDSPASLEEDE